VKLSPNGRRVLAQVEACVLTPYQDGKHHSIGFGHNGPEVAAMNPITVPKAFEMLEQDLIPREELVKTLVKKPLTQEQFDALVVLTYQSGNRYLPAFAHLINAGQMKFLRKIWSFAAYEKGEKEEGDFKPGLAIRRRRERDIFFKGNYGPVEAPIKLWDGNPRTMPFKPYDIKDADLGGS
jgi:lysozyme